MDGGRATGHFREIAKGRVHFALGAIIGYYGRNKVCGRKSEKERKALCN